jgi:hypothetical protein
MMNSVIEHGQGDQPINTLDLHIVGSIPGIFEFFTVKNNLFDLNIGTVSCSPVARKAVRKL